MSVVELNPDSQILQQMEGHWKQYFAIMLYKLSKEGAVLTVEDIELYSKENPIFLVHGTNEDIQFRFVSAQEAENLMILDKAKNPSGVSS